MVAQIEQPEAIGIQTFAHEGAHYCQFGQFIHWLERMMAEPITAGQRDVYLNVLALLNMLIGLPGRYSINFQAADPTKRPPLRGVRVATKPDGHKGFEMGDMMRWLDYLIQFIPDEDNAGVIRFVGHQIYALHEDSKARNRQIVIAPPPTRQAESFATEHDQMFAELSVATVNQLCRKQVAIYYHHGKVTVGHLHSDIYQTVHQDKLDQTIDSVTASVELRGHKEPDWLAIL